MLLSCPLALLLVMGCVQSLKCKPRSVREGVAVLELRASIDPEPTSIDESSRVVLRYRTPHFRASARVLLPPLRSPESWTVGWIQACERMRFHNQYGDQGVSSWELPDLRDGKIPVISDSDGVNYPWYGNTTETCTVVGPTKKPSLLSVSMNDNFYPSVTWAVPVGPGAEPQLSGISRDQSFITWLVAREQFSGEMLVLRTLRWRMKLQISIDPNKPLGQRSTLGPPTAQEPPQLIQNQPVPISALIKPNANDAQVLMWRPSTGLARVVIPAKFSER